MDYTDIETHKIILELIQLMAHKLFEALILHLTRRNALALTNDMTRNFITDFI
jgi:hypothetical protein